jgi:hypothetical protein
MSVNQLRQTLREGGFSVSGFAEDILTRRIAVASSATKIELVAVSTDDLGLERDASRELIYARAKECGLDLVPPEAGPQLRLQYPKQRDGEHLFIGMEPITACDGNKYIFLVYRLKARRWLFGDLDSPGGREGLWVFGYQHGTAAQRL